MPQTTFGKNDPSTSYKSFHCQLFVSVSICVQFDIIPCFSENESSYDIMFPTILYRYIIIKYAHYGLGLSNGFSQGGTRYWILKATYFILLLSYISIALTPHLIKSYKGDLLEDHVKGRICSMKRWKEFCYIPSHSIFFFRLEFDKDTTRKTSHTYLLPRINQIVTSCIWLFFFTFFKRRISAFCPQGVRSSIGGKKKRNILTLGTISVTFSAFTLLEWI